jgi:hypothetical protein
MGSGILELVQQSQYSSLFNTDPQITFFRIIYHKYTHFCKESIVEYFDDTPDWGKQVTLTLSKVGDLIHRMYLVCEIKLNINRMLTISEINSFFININIIEDPLKTLIENRVNGAANLPFNLVQDIIQQLDVSDIIHKILSGSLTSFTNDHESDLIAEINTTLDQTYYNFNPIHLDNISENKNNVITVKELLELYDSYEIYRAYLVIDYLYLVESLSTIYTENQFNIKTWRSAVLSVINHPILQVINIRPSIVFTPLFAHFILANISIDIGGNKITEYDYHLYNCYMLLNKTFDNHSYQEMITPIPDSSGNFTLYIPLIFWYNLFNSLALPCVALKYHDVVLNMTFNDISTLASFKPSIISDYSLINLSNCYVLTEYISVTHREKVKFTTNPLEYLIIQNQVLTQESPTNQSTISLDINFFHPCKELYWIVVTSDEKGKFDQEYYILGTKTLPIVKSQIIINNEVIGSDHSTFFYSTVQPYDKHSRIPVNGINMYSFSLEPEEYQPSGSCNLAFIPNRTLQVTLDPSLYNSSLKIQLNVYCTNYNILRIANGFARLMYE